MRKQLFDLVDNKSHSATSIIYAAIMLIAIIACITPLMFREEYEFFKYLEIFGCSIFVFDYLAKWITADFRCGRHGVKSFILHPFTAWAIFDLVTILPSFNILSKGLVSQVSQVPQATLEL